MSYPQTTVEQSQRWADDQHVGREASEMDLRLAKLAMDPAFAAHADLLRAASEKVLSAHNWCRWAMHMLGCEPAEPHVLRDRFDAITPPRSC